MNEKPSDELISRYGHNFPLVIILVITPFETDISVVQT